MRIAADVGGTFTDIVVETAAGRIARKVPSTPDAFERGVIAGALAGAAGAQATLADVVAFRHATTIATNAVLERRGPLTGLVTTEGFRDVLELGRLRTPSLYDLGWRKPPALAPRRFRVEIGERMLADGTALAKPDLESLRPRLEALVGQGVTALAVSLLNAYVNPEHEELVAAWIGRAYPQLHVTVATHVVREAGEYERTSTAVLNAYLQPVAARYLRQLSDGLRDAGCTAPILVMQSSGGMTPVLDAERFPAHILESGPAAGVLAAAAARPHGRTGPRDQLRHGRDDGQGRAAGGLHGGLRDRVLGRVGRVERDPAVAQRRLSGAVARGRPGRGGCRRRQHRRGRRRRRAPGRPAQRRRRPGAGLLRARRSAGRP